MFLLWLIGHTPNVWYVNNFSVTIGYYVWVKKGGNYERPKFTMDECFIEDESTHEVKLKGKRFNNILMISLDYLSLEVKCLMVSNNGSWF